MRFVFVSACFVAAACAHACSPSRDVVPETKDVRIAGSSGAPTSTAGAQGGYTHLARRAHGLVGLVGARNVPGEDAERLVEHIADELDSCASRLEQQGALVSGAARMVIAAGPRGNAEVGDTQIEPGNAIAANALLCLVAPARATPFAASSAGADAGIPAILIEVKWGPIQIGKAPLPSDAAPPVGSDL